ncbi:MAG: thrombospondin type 3 repeat-containing protein [Planctomycetes bacterium]|nr:thrombospondin type 3 repeat-containing protein [Planctomycetota bacterium]
MTNALRAACTACLLSAVSFSQAVPNAGADQSVTFPAGATLAGAVTNVSPLDWWTADGNLTTENKIVKCDATGIASSVGPLFNHNSPTQIFGWPSDLVWIGTQVWGIESGLRYLYTVDPTTGECFPVGPANTWNDVYCLAYDVTGNRLWGVDLFKKKLLRFNRTTGAVTASAGSLAGWPLIRSLAYEDPTGWLYAVDQQSNKMIRIDPATGSATFFKQMTIDPTYRIEELHYWHGKMYASKGYLDGAGSLIGHRLAEVDMTAGTYTDIGPYIADVSPHSLVINSLPETFQWSQDSGPATAAFSSTTALNATVTFPLPGTYVLRLTANNWPTPAFDTLTVTVANNDLCPDDPNKTEPGQCGCGVPDTDSDADGVADCNDGCPNDANKLAPGACGCGVADTDSDGDGTPNCADDCPSDPTKTSPGACGCGVADTDSDGDGTADCIDACPTDPAKTHPGVCGCGVADTDGDGDGTPDCIDGCPTDPTKIAPGACGCGVIDVDDDGDGIATCVDNCPFVANVDQADSDGDTRGDACDGCPLDGAKTAPGACGCGQPDTDDDGDGIATCVDNCPFVSNLDQANGDGDAQGDLCDGCPTDGTKTSPDACGCGVPDADGDGDGTPDCIDGCPSDPAKLSPGACGCGQTEADGDGDGVPDCVDGCASDPNKTVPGLCGCGVADADQDGDSLVDCADNCPGVSNLDQADGDGDGVGDVCDNCGTLPNVGQSDCDQNGIGDVCDIQAGAADCDGNGVPDACELATHDCNSNGVLDACDLTAGTSLDVNTNQIPDECEPSSGTPFCFGDGTGAACPCGNTGTTGGGCANSAALGALLANLGGTSVSLDNAQLQATQMPHNKSGLIFLGTNKFAGGASVPFGDGLICVQPKFRFPVKNSGVSGSFLVVQPASITPTWITAGSTRYFQAWYRDPAGPCGGGYNFSNGLSVTFTP